MSPWNHLNPLQKLKKKWPIKVVFSGHVHHEIYQGMHDAQKLLWSHTRGNDHALFLKKFSFLYYLKPLKTNLGSLWTLYIIRRFTEIWNYYEKQLLSIQQKLMTLQNLFLSKKFSSLQTRVNNIQHQLIYTLGTSQLPAQAGSLWLAIEVPPTHYSLIKFYYYLFSY